MATANAVQPKPVLLVPAAVMETIKRTVKPTAADMTDNTASTAVLIMPVNQHPHPRLHPRPRLPVLQPALPSFVLLLPAVRV